MVTVALSYDDNGRTGRTPFVFVHGWCCNRTFFAPQYEYFGRHERAVAVDLRGHGKSPMAEDGDYSISSFAGDIAALMADLDLAPAVVVGHSLGGVVACSLAADYPDRVAAVVMVDPAPLAVSDELRPVLRALFAEIAGPGGQQARARLVEGMFMTTDDPERRAEIARTMEAVPQEVAAPAMAGLLALDGEAALAKVSCAIASIGSDGPINDPRIMKAANPKLLVGQTLASGHFNQLEVPDQVNAMIDQFLRVSL